MNPNMDPGREILGRYQWELKKLTFNSKPIINHLTIMAGDNKHVHEQIVSMICDRIAAAPITMMLPPLYLLDSIVKNIGDVYVTTVSRKLERVYCETFERAPEEIRASLLRLLRTWNGVFHPHIVQRIEGLVARIQSTIPAPPMPVASSRRPPVSAALPPPRERYVMPSPTMQPPPAGYVLPYGAPPPGYHDHYGRSPDSYPPAYSTYRAGPYHAPPPAPPPAPVMHQHPPPVRPDYAHNVPPPHNTGESYRRPTGRDRDRRDRSRRTDHQAVREPRRSLGALTAPEVRSLLEEVNGAIARAAREGRQPSDSLRATQPLLVALLDLLPQPGKGRGVPVTDPLPADLVEALKAQGLITSSTSGTIPQPTAPRTATGCSWDTLRIKRPGLVDELYPKNTKQCNLCGLRFPDEGALRPHLDWHFRLNRRQKQKLKTPFSRQWYLTPTEWQESKGYEELQSATSTPFFENAGQEAGEEEVTQHVLARDEYNKVCPGCEEEFEQTWDDAAEDWQFADAILVRERNGSTIVFHTSCAQPLSQSDQNDGGDGEAAPEGEANGRDAAPDSGEVGAAGAPGTAATEGAETAEGSGASQLVEGSGASSEKSTAGGVAREVGTAADTTPGEETGDTYQPASRGSSAATIGTQESGCETLATQASANGGIQAEEAGSRKRQRPDEPTTEEPQQSKRAKMGE